MNNILTFKSQLTLSRLTSDFFDYIVEALGLVETFPIESIQSNLKAWFLPVIENQEGYWAHTQYQSEHLHQKYRLALEFAATEAGFNVVAYEPVNGGFRRISGNHFWLRGVNPDDISWLFEWDNAILAKGFEKPGAISPDTLEDWLLEHINYFVEIRKVADAKR